MTLRFAFGILLGVFFYGGLRLTVRRLVTAKHPLALSLGSLLVRMTATLAGFLFAFGGRWQNAAACLLGFTAARFIVILPKRRVNRSATCT